MKEQPNYYAILTSNVRYSKLINANEKLLFAEITALSNSSGICFASNSYFAELFDVTPQAISKWINNLQDKCFIECRYVYKENSKEIEKRQIKCINIDLYVSTGIDTYQQGIKDNIYNNTNNNILPLNDGLYVSTEYTKKYNSYAREILKDIEVLKHLKGNLFPKVINDEFIKFTIRKYLYDFIKDLVLRSVSHENKISFQTHFNYWLAKLKEKDKLQLLTRPHDEVIEQKPIRYV